GTRAEEIVRAVVPVRVQMVKAEPHRVISDRVHLENGDILLAGHGLALVGRMALDLGARAFDAQIFGAEIEVFATIEDHGQRLAVLAQAQLGRPRLGGTLGHIAAPAAGFLAPRPLPRYSDSQLADPCPARTRAP